jgi:dihydrofolate reductase
MLRVRLDLAARKLDWHAEVSADRDRSSLRHRHRGRHQRSVRDEPWQLAPRFSDSSHKLVFTRSGKLDFDAITRPSSPENLEAANANAEKNQSARLSPEETKKNQQSWRDPSVASDIVAELARQRAQPGKPLIAYGGASFARDLIKHDLIDEYRLVVHPVALGKGQAIFDGLAQPLALKLVSSSAFPGVASARIFARNR